MSSATVAPGLVQLRRTERRIYAGWFGVQAVAGVALWVAIFSSATVREWFELVGERPEVTDGFFWADMVVVATSALAALGLWRGASWGVVAAAVTAGGVLYPTAYLFGWVSDVETGGVALAVMAVVSLGSCWSCWRGWRLSASHSASRSVTD